MEKVQGRGTFVCYHPPGSGSRKDQAMEMIDLMLDKLDELGFSMDEVNIFLDLKMRERAVNTPSLKVAVIECNPENLSQMAAQLRKIEGIELYSYLLAHVEAYPYNLDEEMDLIVTTSEHADFLRSVLTEREKIARVALRLSLSSMARIVRLPPGERAGILGCSRRFGDLLYAACAAYASNVLVDPPAVISRDFDWQSFLAGKTALLIPDGLEKFLEPDGIQFLQDFAGQGKLIRCVYEIDEGSFLYLQEKIERLRDKP